MLGVGATSRCVMYGSETDGGGVDREQLRELHYITPISNVSSIAARGLLSHRRAARHNPDSVALATVQERREAKPVPRGRPLHEYVNLYVNARNPMLYLRSQGDDHEGLCVLDPQ